MLGHTVRPAWHTRPDGTIAAECGSFRLLVHPPVEGAYACFLVRRRMEQDQCADALVASWTRDEPEAAMREAKAARRLRLAFSFNKPAGH